jgi:hypothetical protein
MERYLKEVLQGKEENRIAPFFWQHGESDEALKEEIDAIEQSGIRALCVESRPHEGFGTQSWWEDMDLILSECKKRGMKVWLLDDKHFPTGYANGLLKKKDPSLWRKEITEQHMDVTGPIEGGAVITEGWCEKEDKLVAVLACERGKKGEKLTGKVIDVTPNVSDGLVYLDLPEGCWRILFLIETRSKIQEDRKYYCDPLSSESMDVLLEAVYEPHWEHYKEYFGTTFQGFFSDEPCFANNMQNHPSPEFGTRFACYPWREELVPLLREEYGCDPFLLLPALWYEMPKEKTAQARIGYMNVITRLYEKNFSQKLGNWSREHGVEYIGHIIEDNGAHLRTGYSAGHYFRSLEGQDMAGIDVVLHQIVPGLTEYQSGAPVSYEVIDAEMFHYVLAKLGISLAQQDPRKNGRLMCEIFGAYGWAEGLKTMKWLLDHMLVRGVNFFVPHAFSPKFPDPDCPPHFYAGGQNPQFSDFKLLMDYMNRMSHLISDGRHMVSCGILYEAEAEWSGSEHQPMQKAAKVLYDHQIDYEFVPSDYLENAKVDHGKLLIGNQQFPALVIPYAKILPKKLLLKLAELAKEGLLVIYLEDYPSDTLKGKVKEEWFEDTKRCRLSHLPKLLRKSVGSDVKIEKESQSLYLRFYHYKRGKADYYLFFNEDIHHTIDTKVMLSAFSGGEYLIYDGMENRCCQAYSDGKEIPLCLEPYQSVMLVFGTKGKELPKVEFWSTVQEHEISGEWKISTASQKEFPQFQVYEETGKLRNLSAKGELPRFSGHFRYEKTVMIKPKPGRRYLLDCGQAGETVSVAVNGIEAGKKLVPPYQFDITGFLKEGTNKLSVTVTNHLGYQERDFFSRYLLMEPSGLLGPVSVLEQKEEK